MILTVIVISGTLMGLAVIAGILMIYQLRQAGDFSNSAKAIFAADTGVNWWIYDKDPLPTITSSTVNSTFTNKASFEIIEVPPNGVKVIGQAGNSKRALLFQNLGGFCKPDIILAFEKSRRINLADWNNNKESLKEFATFSLNANPAIIMGLVSFHSDGNPDISPPTSTLSAILATIDSIGRGDLGINLRDAINKSDDVLNDSSPSGPLDREPDSEAPDFLVIVIAHDPTIPVGNTYRNTKTAADNAKAKGVEIFVVGVDITDLDLKNFLINDIATTSTNDHYFDASDFINLRDVLNNEVFSGITNSCL